MTRKVFDIGMHQCEDTEYYLKRGLQVFAVDADPEMVERAKERFAKEAATGQLTVIHAAVAEHCGEATFYRSENSLWSSCMPDIASRDGLARAQLTVPAVTLKSLIEQYGVPDYCKIDIEGADLITLRSLKGTAAVPQYISVESECVGDQGAAAGSDEVATLRALADLGYQRFKLVDQRSLVVLDLRSSLYREAPPLMERVMGRLGIAARRPYNWGEATEENRRQLQQKYSHAFPNGASGPFGEELTGQWTNFDYAARCYHEQRQAYFRLPTARPYGFWCDWHAMRS